MAVNEKVAEEESGAPKAAKAKKAAKAEKRFSVETLQKHCRELFGVSSVTFAGATASIDTEKKYTIAEMRDMILKWSQKEAI